MKRTLSGEKSELDNGPPRCSNLCLEPSSHVSQKSSVREAKDVRGVLNAQKVYDHLHK